MNAHPLFRNRMVAVVLTVLACAVSTVRADKDADRRAAADGKLDSKARLAACDRLLAAKDLTKDERAWACLRRANLYRAAKKDKEALADFAEAEKLTPDNPQIYRDRGLLFFNRKRYGQAEEQLAKAIQRDPRHAWSYYARGMARVNQKKHDAALKDYDKALELHPRYTSAYAARARLQIRRKDYAAAVQDCDAALALYPYYVPAYSARATANEAQGKSAAALHDYAIALALDPNSDKARGGLARLAKAAQPAAAEAKPIAWEAPKKGLRISYLHTIRPKPPKKDEMEEAIGELAGWFKRKKVPEPKFRMFMVREIGSSKDKAVTTAPRRKFPKIDRKKPPIKTADYYLSLWPTILPMGSTGQVLQIEYDRKPLDALWPLQPGTKGQGQAKLVYVGPDPLPPQAAFLGCKKPGDRVTLGKLTWKGAVTKREKVVVPAGVFEAVAVRFEEEMAITMFGQTRKQASVVTWWYAPAVRWWVKRAREVGTDLLVDEAEEIR